MDFTNKVNFSTMWKDKMIEHLKIGRTANFYKRKKVLSNSAISQLFTTVRRNTTEPSRNLFREVRTASGEVGYSIICFDFARQPSFLKPEADVWERIYGFLLIVEKEDLVAVLKSGLDLPTEFKSSYLEKLAGHQIEIAIAQEDAVFEHGALDEKNVMQPTSCRVRVGLPEAGFLMKDARTRRTRKLSKRSIWSLVGTRTASPRTKAPRFREALVAVRGSAT